MELLLNRMMDNGKATIGAFFIDGVPQCFMLEDEFREVKVKGETRIPAGRYEIKLRTEGSTHEKYKNHKDPEIRAMHKGMLHLQEVPNFLYILIHILNTEKETEGCLGPGEIANYINGVEVNIKGSTSAYKRIYRPIAHELISNNKVYIEIKDCDRI